MIWLKKKQKGNYAKQQKQKQIEQDYSRTRFRKNFSEENEFPNITYSDLYPSDNISPRLYGTIKAHDVTKPDPSIPIAKAIDKILQQLSEDYEDLKTRKKLMLIDV